MAISDISVIAFDKLLQLKKLSSSILDKFNLLHYYKFRQFKLRFECPNRHTYTPIEDIFSLLNLKGLYYSFIVPTILAHKSSIFITSFNSLQDLCIQYDRDIQDYKKGFVTHSLDKAISYLWDNKVRVANIYFEKPSFPRISTPEERSKYSDSKLAFSILKI
ncbi:MAG: hypothetical protein Ta2D_13640 [Rickettsiales bacterium]|nr:MAG: hypothetical protein Ta2D_13640 [Rickettsiales bacterium]